LPLNKIGNINKINKAIGQLAQDLERAPSIEDIALFLDLSEQEIKESLTNTGHHLSMDAPLVQDEDNTLYDVIASKISTTPETNLIYESLQKEVQRIIETLPQREADIVKYYFGLEGKHSLTLEEIGEKFDLTRERVRQIKEKAIRRMKHASKCKNLKAYLG